MADMNLAIIINTTDKYSFLWNGWWHYFKKNFEPDYPVYFLNEKKDINFPLNQIKVDIPEKELWTKKLRESVKQIPEDNLFILLEDIFITKKFGKKEFENIYNMFKLLNADALRIRMVKSKYATVHDTVFKTNGVGIKKLDQHSRYLISHGPNIWKKSFLLECLKVDESPWANETRGSNRMKGKDYNIYSYIKPNWFDDACRKGALTKIGKKLLK